MPKLSALGVYKNLTDVLVEDGLLDETKAKEINLKRLKTGQTEEEIIRSLRIISEDDLVKAKAKFLRVDFVNLDETAFSPEALSFVPRSVAEKYSLF